MKNRILKVHFIERPKDFTLGFWTTSSIWEAQNLDVLAPLKDDIEGIEKQGMEVDTYLIRTKREGKKWQLEVLTNGYEV